MTSIVKERDHFIDFLRAFGLLLLVVAHTWAPKWLAVIRTFDVPLMVFISAICYKPLRGGYLAYSWKRFKRIYIPVAVFLTLYFIGDFILYFSIGIPHKSLGRIVGSYLLLNSPSIGYVWIMRVFLLMSLILPLLHRVFEKASAPIIIAAVLILIIIQDFLIVGVFSIDNKIIRFVTDETVLYAVGYSSIAMIGLRIKTFSLKALGSNVIIFGLLIIWYLWKHEWVFDPNLYKYPPRTLYLLYGIFCSVLLFLLRPMIEKIIRCDAKIFSYLSEYSMWIYLWHIVMVNLVAPWANTPNFWGARFFIVLIGALALCHLYQWLIRKLPDKAYRFLK